MHDAVVQMLSHWPHRADEISVFVDWFLEAGGRIKCWGESSNLMSITIRFDGPGTYRIGMPGESGEPIAVADREWVTVVVRIFRFENPTIVDIYPWRADSLWVQQAWHIP